MTLKKVSALACFNLSFHWFAIGIIIPVMTLMLIEKGLNLAQVGIIFAAYSGATVLFELPTGGLADSIGRKKVYLAAIMFQIIEAVLLIFLDSFGGIFICFILMGISRALSSGTMDAHFIDQFYKVDPKVNLQKEIARIGIFIPLALGAGSLIGGFLPMTLGVLTKSSILNSVYASNYLGFTAALIFQFAATFFLIKEDKKVSGGGGIVEGFKKVPEVIGTSMKFGIKQPVIFLLLCATFAWGFSISGLEQLWQPRVAGIIDQSTGSWIFGLLTCGYFLAGSLGNMLVSPICRLFKNNYSGILFAARLIMGILYFLLAFQNNILFFSSLYFTLFMFNGMQGSPESAIFNDKVPSDKRSTLLSFLSLFLQSGGIIGAILMGFLAENLSIRHAWICASIVIMVSALLYLFIPGAGRKTGISGGGRNGIQ